MNMGRSHHRDLVRGDWEAHNFIGWKLCSRCTGSAWCAGFSQQFSARLPFRKILEPVSMPTVEIAGRAHKERLSGYRPAAYPD